MCNLRIMYFFLLIRFSRKKYPVGIKYFYAAGLKRETGRAY